MTTAPMPASETLRKLVHIGFGFSALLLRWLAPWQAAALAVAAFLHNWLVLPRLYGRRISRSPSGTDRGIMIYPLAVLGLVLVFPRDPGLAAAAWAILAFGDGLATIAGRAMPRPRLPWNRAKTLAGSATFFLGGAVAAWLTGRFVHPDAPYAVSWLTIGLAAAAACAIAESIHLEIDDNVVVPAVAALVMTAVSRITRQPELLIDSTSLGWLAANGVLATAGFFARSVSLSGAIGGFLLGAIMILCAGWELYVALLIFFSIGTAATKLGYRTKAAEGLAQEKGGKRGFTHAWSNTGVAACFALLISVGAGAPEVLWLAAIASLATAAADTTASEIGQLYGRRAFLPTSFRRVARGTEGAISVEGTMAGAAAAAIVAATGVGLVRTDLAIPAVQAFLIVFAAAVLGSYLESLAGNWNRRQARPVPNGALNFLNTLAGALIAGGLWMLR
ncbi:MAG TPA: DUF92 domain-containing protein [Thermoanaerobaculia bacterium]|nr:DUF92 domain-containing protein [Thermoanaerobaculia bacterium]